MSQITVEQAMQMAMEHHRAGRLPEAEGMYRQILAASPDHPDALHLLGLMALQMNQLAPAIQLLRRAVEVAPGAASFHDTLGQALAAEGEIVEAILSYERAIDLRPEFAEAYTNLAAVLLKLERFDEAIARLNHAIELQPAMAQAHNNLGTCYNQLARPDEAIESFKHALMIAPVEPTIHYNLATALLLKGDLPAGLREYEWRWQVPALNLTTPNFTTPQWQGEDLRGKRILLYAEQGYGDAIQFIRYAPIVAACGGRVMVCCPAPLEGLMKSVPEIEHVFPADEPPTGFDVHCPLLRLPLLLKTTLETIPANIPYVHADPARVEHFRQRLTDDPRKKIGLIWAGRPEHSNDRNRSVRLDQLAPLAEIPDVRYFSLQFGPAAEQAKSPPAGMNLTDWTSDLADFSDTAALMQNLDLIVSVDTAPAHLAGALGRKLFVLLPYLPDWRWQLDRPDSPWYPTARLFRQHKRGEWAAPIERVTGAIGKFR